MRTHFIIKEHLVTIGAVKCSLFLPHSQSTRKFEEQTKVTFCGKKSRSKSYSPSQYIILICYPLLFIRKVEHSYHVSCCFGLHQYAMTFRPAGLSRDPHEIGWKDSLPLNYGVKDIRNDIRQIIITKNIYIYTWKIAIKQTSVGLAHTRPKYL